MAQFEAVKRWFEDDWMRVEPKLRTSIVEGISVFLSLFDDSRRATYTFCPRKDLDDPARNPKRHPRYAAGPLADLLEHGKGWGVEPSRRDDPRGRPARSAPC